jgi:hypothetical protein
MKRFSSFGPSRLLLPLFAIAAGLVALSSSAVYAAVGAVAQVVYSPTIREVQGTLPYGDTYPLTITSPSNLPSGSPVTVTFTKIVNGFLPPGATEATALSYVTFSQPSLTFTGPNQSQTVTVSLLVPATAVPGQYGYQIKTAGWPVSPTSTNDGTSINATVSLAPVPNPPTVLIGAPTDGQEVVLPVGATFPYSLPFTFTATSTGNDSSVITTVDSDLNGSFQPVTTTGLNSFNVTSSGTLSISRIGTHVVTARATNGGGTATDVNTFVVRAPVVPPTVVINSPVDGTIYTYRLGEAPTVVQLRFVGSTTAGGIRSLAAKMNGVPLAISSTNLLTLAATGSLDIPMDGNDEGAYTIEVEAVDIWGQVATASTRFSVDVLEPTPTIAITTPTNGQVFTLPSGATTMNIDYRFVTNTTSGFTISSVSATLGTTPLSPTTTGLSTASAISTGTMSNLGVGTYTLNATGISAGISVNTNVQFSVRASSLVPPSVVINTPPAGSTYTLASGGSLTIPLTFTGTSNNDTTVINAVTAKLGTTTLPVSATLNQKVVNATSSMTVCAAGTYTITVTATDAVGTATASRTFSVTVVVPKKVCGFVFFDVDRDNAYDCGEFGLSGVGVRLTNSAGAVVATATTDGCGNYLFNSVLPGTYTLSTAPYSGLVSTTGAKTVTVAASNVTAPKLGLGLDLPAFRSMRADGKSHGFWKTNLDKAISGKSGGAQVSATNMSRYTCNIGDFAMTVFDNMSMKSASAILGSNSAFAADLLSKQLIASEYNYMNGAYINGNRQLTFLFLYWGEYMRANANSLSNDALIKAKDWFDAYNNSYGGLVLGPQ